MSKSNRSDKYQHLYHEVFAGDDALATYTNAQSISGMLNPFEYNEEVLELEEELKKKFWILAEQVLTENQKKILKLYRDGYTQQEISKILDVNQSSICKCLQGNTDYAARGKDGKPKQYGGIQKKLRKLLLNRPDIKELLARINELKTERY